MTGQNDSFFFILNQVLHRAGTALDYVKTSHNLTTLKDQILMFADRASQYIYLSN